MAYILTHEEEVYRAKTQEECQKFLGLVFAPLSADPKDGTILSAVADQALEREGYAIHEVKD